jgi:putative transposase
MPMLQWDDFLQFCRERVAEYNARPHASLNGLSPDQALQGFIAKGWQADRMQPDALALLFRPRMARTVQRGEVRLFNNQYFSRDLTELHGQTVHVAYDIHDPQQVWVYLPDGRYVCSAEWGANRSQYFPTSQVQHARDQRAAAQLRNLAAKRDAIEQERDARPALTVIDSPVSLPGIRSSDIAGAFNRMAEAREPLNASPLRVVDAEVVAGQGFSVPATPQLRIRQWHALSGQAAAGEVLTDKETRWLASYPKSREFSVMNKQPDNAGKETA